MSDRVELECESRIDDLVVCPRDDVRLTSGELESAARPFWGTYVHAERPVYSVEHYAIFGFDS